MFNSIKSKLGWFFSSASHSTQSLTPSSTSFALHPELATVLDDFRSKRNFDPKYWINNKVTIFNDYMRKNGLSACVINVSGGIDSSVTLGLCCEAMKQNNSPIKRIIGVSQPIYSSNAASDGAIAVTKKYDIPLVTINQTKIYDDLRSLVSQNVAEYGLGESSQFADGQLRSYMRTPVIYYMAQLLSANGNPCLVMGTGNKDEDGYLAYFCKAGDGVVDVQLIADIHKSEVYRVGHELQLPKIVLDAVPTADLWEGQSDEEELGITYDFIELWMNFLELSKEEQEKIKNNFSEDALKQFNEWSSIAIKVHNRNAHKLNSPVNL